jgi:hypothetical protein
MSRGVTEAMGDRDSREPPPSELVLYQRMFVDRSFSEQAFDDRMFTADVGSDEL